MANIKSNSDNRYYNKLININQKNFLPIFTTSKFIISQNYNNGSWIVVSEQNNYANTYQTIVDSNNVIQGTYGTLNATATKNYIHDIYLGGEHIAGGFGVASAQLRDNITYVGNSYNAVFSYIVDSRTKLSLEGIKFISNNANTYSYISTNNSILSTGLNYNPLNNSYTLSIDSNNIFNYGLLWDNAYTFKDDNGEEIIGHRESYIYTDENHIQYIGYRHGVLEEEPIFPDMMHEYDVLWDDFNFSEDNSKIICNSTVHYGISGSSSSAVRIAGPLKRTYNNLKTSPYAFRYYYTIDDAYVFFKASDLSEDFIEDDYRNEFVWLFEYYMQYDESIKKDNILKFYRTYNGTEIKILVNLLECYIEIDVNDYITEHKDLIKSNGFNIDIFFLNKEEESKKNDIMDLYKNPIIFFYKYANVEIKNNYDKFISTTSETLSNYNEIIDSLTSTINNLTKKIEDLEEKYNNISNK